jgi:hypothetical protein
VAERRAEKLERLSLHLARERARPYRAAVTVLQARLDPLAHDDPQRPRLIQLLRAARQRAEAIERGQP